MNRIIKMIAMLSLFLAFAPMAFGAWTFNPNYANAINVSVSNWNYTQSWGFQSPADFALIRLNGIGNPAQLNITGWDASYNRIGSIPYYLVNSFGKNTTILVSKYTSTNPQGWAHATIFYNPFSGSNSTGSLLLGSTNASFGNQKLYIIGDGALARNFVSTPSWESSNTLNFSFTAGYQTYDMVLVANRSMAYRNFNISWFPNQFIHLNISGSPAGLYKLYTSGLTGSDFVSNSPLESKNANNIFLNQTIGNGFEAWFSSTSNQIASEGMTSTGAQLGDSIFNSLTYKNARFIQPHSYYFNMTIDTNTPTSFTLLPSFTSQYALSNSVANPNNGPPIQNYAGYEYRINVSNIRWLFNFTSSANIVGWAGQHVFQFKDSNVTFLMLNLTHYAEMGAYCNNLNIKAFSGGEVHNISFYINKCNPMNSTASFILPNVSLDDFSYNQAYVYYDNPALSLSSGLSNISVKNDWNFENGNDLLVPVYQYATTSFSGSVPFLIKLNSTLNLMSYVGIYRGPPYTDQIYIDNTGLVYAAYGFKDYLGDYPTTFLYTPIYSNAVSATIGAVLTKNLFVAADACVFGGCFLGGNTTNSGGFGDGGGGTDYNVQIYLPGQRPAALYYLASSTYNVGMPEINPSLQTTNITLPHTPPPTTSYGNGTSSLNYTRTTTIEFNSISAPVVLATGVTFPRYVLLMLALIIEIVASTMFSTHQLGHFPFVLMVIGIWIMGLWQYGLIPVALIITIMFILYEYAHSRKSTPESLKRHGA